MYRRCYAAFIITLLLVVLIPLPERSLSGYSLLPSPTAEPTAAPTAEPTPEPTPVPTPTPCPTPAPIGEGSRGDEVYKIQNILYLNGFSYEKPDGIYGQNTYASVQTLKKYINTYFNAGESSDGSVSRRLYNSIEDMPSYAQTVQRGDNGLNVKRVQTRLYTLGYLYGEADGIYGENTERAVAYFQKLNGLFESGVAESSTQEVLFSSAAQASDKHVMPYKLIVDVSDQKVYCCSWSGGEFSNVVRTMKCSTGTKTNPTPLGTYEATTGRGSRWHYFEKWDCWAQYAYYIEGDIMFHSVLYSEQDESTLTKSSLNNLGKRASHGCVRLSVEDAQWIWENCPSHTTVEICD